MTWVSSFCVCVSLLALTIALVAWMDRREK